MRQHHKLVSFARQFRNNPTKAEKRLWYNTLNRRQFEGFKFTRQKVIGQFIVDFYCHELRLIIEVDGKSHDYDDAFEKDQNRENQLKASGYYVIRFSDWEVLNHPDIIFDELNKMVATLKRKQP